MGRRHLQVVRDLGLTLVGVSDANPEALSAAAAEQGLAPELLFADPGALLATRPECVVVATTADSHMDYVQHAARSGAGFVLCEKPMAVSLAQCDAMIEACRAAGTRLAVNHQMRYMEQYTLPREIAWSEELGGLTSVTVVAGNFGLGMNASHYFEMFRFMTGEDPATVTAWFSPGVLPNPRGARFEDRAGSVRVTTESGRRLYMELGSDQGHGVRVVYAGRHGQITVDELAGEMKVSARRPEDRALPTTRYGMPAVERSQRITPADAVAPSRAVLAALIGDAEIPDGRTGRLALAALVAAYESNERGHVPVAVDVNLPRERVFPWA
jgi:predicted dehydrogenase